MLFRRRLPTVAFLLPVLAGLALGVSGTAWAIQQQSAGESAIPPDVLTIPQLPVPPNSTFVIDDTVLIGSDNDWTGQVILSAPYSVIQVTQFFRTEMPKLGWQETAIVRARRTSVSFARDNRVATLRISQQRDDPKRTDIDVVVSPSSSQILPKQPQPQPHQRLSK